MPSERSLTRYSISEWAEASIVLPPSEPIPGDLRLAPTQRGILSAMADPHVRQVSLMCCSQFGKTVMTGVYLGYLIENRPTTMMVAYPRESDAKKFIHDKFEPMLFATPSVNDLVAQRGKRSEGAHNNLMIDFRGGSLTMAHSGSAASMRSTTARLVMADEIDMFEYSVDGDNPLDVLRQRSVMFGDRAKLIIMSTPTLDGESLIQAEFEAGSRNRWNVRCMKCDSDPYVMGQEHLTQDGRLWCPFCGEEITEGDRLEMIATGEWIPGNPDVTANQSFHLDQLSSMFVSLKETVNRMERMSTRGATTQIWALPYKLEELEQLNPSKLREIFVGNERPEAAMVRTVGIDVQGNRLEYQVVDSDLDENSYVVKHEIVPIPESGMTDAFAVISERLKPMRVDMVFVDAGWKPDDVRDCIVETMEWLGGINVADTLEHGSADRVQRIMGHSPSFDKHLIMSKTKGTIKLAVDEAKMKIRDLINMGKLYVNRHAVPNDFQKQLTSERQVLEEKRGGRMERKWVTDGRNEALDCLVYALCAKDFLGYKYPPMVRSGDGLWDEALAA